MTNTDALVRAIEGLKARLAQQHGSEYTALLDLHARLEKQSEHFNNELLAVIQGYDLRRAETHRLLETLAARIGLLPPPAAAPRALEVTAPADEGPMPTFLDGHRPQQINGGNGAH
jgi:hypothetical protein